VELPRDTLRIQNLSSPLSTSDASLCGQKSRDYNICFCNPYASWQKGGIENTNNRLTRELTRKTDAKKISKDDYQEIILNHNLTPRKSLNWLTPLEAFTQNIHLVALQT